MKNMAISIGAACCLSVSVAACGSNGSSNAGGWGETMPTYEVGNETVAVARSETMGVVYPTTKELLASVDTIVEATVVSTKNDAKEVQPDPNAEGSIPGLGPDIYSTVDFRIESVLKGDPGAQSITLAFKSGKRDGEDKTKRISYLHDGLSDIQTADARLRNASEIGNKRFLLFVNKNGVHGVSAPLEASVYLLAHPSGLAEIKPNGSLKFGVKELAPVSASAGLLTIDDVRAEQK